MVDRYSRRSTWTCGVVNLSAISIGAISLVFDFHLKLNDQKTIKVSQLVAEQNRHTFAVGHELLVISSFYRRHDGLPSQTYLPA